MESELKNLSEQFQRATDLSQRVNLAVEISTFCRNHSMERLAKDCIEKVLAETRTADFQHGLGKVLKEKSLLHYSQLELDQALDFGFKALNIFHSVGSKSDISDVLCNIGVYYNALNMDEKGKEYFLKSIRYNPEIIPPLINLGEYYVRREEHMQAIECFEKAIARSQEADRQGDLAFAHKSLGETWNAMGEYEKALECFHKSLNILELIKEEHSKALVFIGISTSYSLKQEYEKAVEYAKESLKIARKLDNSEIYWFCYSTLADIHERMKDFKEAFYYQKQCQLLHEKLHSSKITRRIAELEAVHKIEKKELETQRLLEKSARLASIGTMTAGITHEINQPLNSIVINSEGILFKDDRDRVLPDVYRSSVEKIFKSAQRIDQIIKHIRTYWNSGDDLIKSRAVDVNRSIDEALGFLNQQIRSHGIELITSFAAEQPEILGYQVHLEQIVVNLITNAIHALDKTNRKDKRIYVQTVPEGDCIVLTVEDNGIGLDQDVTDEIFDPFYSTKKTTGMGLGLSIVKNYVNQMKGEITLVNKPDFGVRFKIVFPVLKENI